MNTPSPLIRIRQLGHAWPAMPLFDRLDLDIRPGLSLLTGDEGCGKSTLLRLLAGREPLQTGQIDAAAPVFLADVGHPSLDDTPAGELLQGVPQTLVDGFGLDAHRHKPLYMLSTGSRRKVGLCQTLASPAPVWLIDQPVAALDPPSVRFLVDALRHAARRPGCAVVVADHEAPPGLTPDHTLVLPAR